MRVCGWQNLICEMKVKVGFKLAPTDYDSSARGLSMSACVGTRKMVNYA